MQTVSFRKAFFAYFETYGIRNFMETKTVFFKKRKKEGKKERNNEGTETQHDAEEVCRTLVWLVKLSGLFDLCNNLIDSQHCQILKIDTWLT